MRLTTLFITVFCVHLSAKTVSQRISFSGKEVPLEKIFSVVRQQTGHVFFFKKSILKDSRPVTISVTNEPLVTFLDKVFSDQPLEYTIEDENVFVRSKNASTQGSGSPKPVFDPDPPIDIKGKVVNEKGEPVVVTIIVKGTNGGVVSDNNGEFTVEADENATLLISGVNIEHQEVKVNGRKSITIRVKIMATEEEEVVVAYNKISQRSNVGAVTVVKGEQIQTLPNRSFDKSLQGLVPGLLVTSGSGQPGSSPVNFILRGIATGAPPREGSTARNPLIVVDGVPVFQDAARDPRFIPSDGAPVSNPMAQINPSDIESISVLKDAAAIALYGSKASNGVILVTTKRGKQGRTVFTFRHQTDVASRLEGKVDLLNQQEYLDLVFESYRNSFPGITDVEILADLRNAPSPIDPKFPTLINANGDTSFYPAANWIDAYYRKAAMSMTNELSMSGGNDRSNFYLNLEYTKQNGIVKKSGFDRKSIRFNYENRPKTWLKLGLNTSLSYSVQDFTGQGSFDRLEAVSPLNPIYQTSGEYFYNYAWGQYSSGVPISNPVAASALNIHRNTAYRGLSKLFAELNVLDFTWSSAFGVDFMLNEFKEKIHPLLAVDGSLDLQGKIEVEDFRNANLITTNMLQYNKTRGRHSLQALLGQEAQVLTGKRSVIGMTGFASNPSIDQAIGGTIYVATSAAGKQTLLSYFGQLNYNFSNKYFITGSARTDGSSRFGENERFGTYWSAGAGWVVSEERFMSSLKDWIGYFKLRGSFGPAGNSAGIFDHFRYNYLFMANYLGGVAVYPERGRPPANPSIQWEETFTWDAGLELRMLRNRVSLTADIYNRKTKNLIAENIPLPLGTGYSEMTDNIGDIRNSGIELSVAATVVRAGAFSWDVKGTWSRNRNKLTRSFFPLTTVGSNVANEVGREYNSFYLPVWAGVNPENGRPQWIDTLGKVTEDYFAAKNEFVGKTQPDGFGAVTNTFSWKSFELSAMIYYQYGSQIYYNGAFLQNDGLEPYANQSRAALNRWQKPGDIAANPRRLFFGTTNTEMDLGSYPSTRFLADGDFIRLSNVSLGYTFSQKVMDRLHVSGLKCFVQGSNLATWTLYAGQDPENINPLGSGNFLYPQQRTFSLGLNVNF